LQPRIAFDCVERLRNALLIERSAPQQLYPSDDGSQRRSQFVRERRQENVLRAVRVCELDVEPFKLGGSLFDSPLEVEIQLLQVGARLLFSQHESTVLDTSANRVLHALDVAGFDEVVVSTFL